MDFGSINWLAVVVCVVASMIIGSFWFNPKTFFPMWWKAIGKSDTTPGMAGNMGMMWGLTILAAIVQAIFLSLVVTALGKVMPGGVTLVSGALTGLMIWFGFVAPSSLTNKLFAGQLKAWVLEVGNHLLNFVVMGAILGAWR
jgi:hypothetical protein